MEQQIKIKQKLTLKCDKNIIDVTENYKPQNAMYVIIETKLIHAQ